MPKSQRTHRTTRIVQSIAIPFSQETGVYSACAAPESHFRFFQMTDTSRLGVQCLFTWAHIRLFPKSVALLARSINFARKNNEALRRRAHIVKRKAGEQCQVVSSRWFQNANISGPNHLNRLHAIFKNAFRSLKPDLVPHPNVAERAEKGVPMTGQCHIAPLAWQNRVRKVADGQAQVSSGIALNNDFVYPKARHLKFTKHIAIGKDARYGRTSGALEFLDLDILIDL